MLIVCAALAALLAGFAIVQYRWSTRVAAADIQRETDHLHASASLFASEFNRAAGEAAWFLQDDAWKAFASHQPLNGIPPLLGEIFFADFSAKGKPLTQQLGADRRFSDAPLPEWAAVGHCGSVAIERPTAIVSPVMPINSQIDGPTDAPNAPGHGDKVHVVQERSRPDRCFIARIDETYVRGVLFPKLIGQTFGATAAGDYDFAVVSTIRSPFAIYGTPGRADLRQPFFSIDPARLAIARTHLATHPPAGKTAVIVERVEASVISAGPVGLASLYGPGIWELQAARKGMPLAALFEWQRRRDLVASLAVEALLLGAILFLVIAARRMQQLADRKMQFIAGVSHELRTPVSAIAMLSRNQADGLVAGADRVKQYGELIHQQSRRLNEMVEQTLQYAGIHSSLRKPARQEIDVRQLIEDAVAARRDELLRAGFHVEIDVAPDVPKISGDPQWLRTALDNLLSNAQKYADRGRWVRVSAAYSPAAREALIHVEDRGAGIDPADRDEIFEPFCRGRAASEAQIPGTGIGLSLVRSAVEAHQGTVTLVSEPGRGSTFTLHLPA
jgi:signal transduction histidine kinase